MIQLLLSAVWSIPVSGTGYRQSLLAHLSNAVIVAYPKKYCKSLPLML